MRLYFSGGSPIVESHVKKPDVMMSFWCHTTMINETKPGKKKKKRKPVKPNSRMRNLMALRQEAKAKKGKK